MFADSAELTLTPGKPSTVKIHAYASGPYPAFSVGTYAPDPALTAKLSAKTATDGDELTLTITASAVFVEQAGANIVFLFAQGKDYTTKRHLIVHAK